MRGGGAWREGWKEGVLGGKKANSASGLAECGRGVETGPEEWRDMCMEAAWPNWKGLLEDRLM